LPGAASAPWMPPCPNCAAPCPCPRAPCVNCSEWCKVSKLYLGWVVLAYLAVFLGLFLLRNAWCALVGFHLTLLPLLAPRWRMILPRFLAPVSIRILLPVAAAGLSAGLGLWLVWPYAGIPADYPARVAALGLTGAIWLPFIAYFTLVNPFLEEACWRDALASPSPWPAPVDFLFAGYHLIILAPFARPVWMLAAFVLLAIAGWLWRWVSRYTDSLMPAALSHMLADFSILLVLYVKS